MRRRLATATAGLVASLALSAAVYYYTNALFVFLLVPFVPLLFRGLAGESSAAEPSVAPDSQVRECPRCDFRTSEAYEYCPHDGTRLE